MAKKESALYLCPGCGAFVNESANKCPNCGNLLDGFTDDEIEQPDEPTQETTAEAKPETVEPEQVPEETQSVTLFLCSSCGAFTSDKADICSNCGASILDEIEEPAPLIKPEDPEAELLDMLITSESELEDAETFFEDLKKIESKEDVDSLIESIPFKDPDESLDPDAPEGLVNKKPDETDDLLDQLVLVSDDEEPELVQQEKKPRTFTKEKDDIPTDKTGKVRLDSKNTIAMCSSCGSFVSETAEVCNVCGNSLKEDKKFIPGAAPKIDDSDKSGDEAESILRSLLGVEDDAELDRTAFTRFQSDGSIGLCTICGAFISQEADACPVCGTHIEDMPEFVPSIDLAGPEKTKHGLALCPHCGALVQEGAKECFSCVKPIPEGAILAKYQPPDEVDETDKASNMLKTFLGVEKALELPPFKDPTFLGLDLCPDCGAFVSAAAVVCSVCGHAMFEGADEIEDINIQLDEIGVLKCPNCDSRLSEGSSECNVCGLIFGDREEPKTPTGSDIDISAFLETELENTIHLLEESSIVEPEPAPELPEPEVIPDADEDLWEEVLGQDPIDTLPEILPELIAAQEPLEFIEPFEIKPLDQDALYEPDDFELYEQDIAPERTEMLTSQKTEENSKLTSKYASWGTGVYISTIALGFFVITNIVVPGNYASGLALIFGTLLAYGIFMWFTDKVTFVTGDLMNASLFHLGAIIAAIPLLHWETEQPALDIALLAVSLLLISLGLFRIRTRVRFIFLWFSGITLFFVASITNLAYTGYEDFYISPTFLVSSMGAGLVLLSLIFLEYSRETQIPIESEVLFGETSYLKRDWALISYDKAPAKPLMQREKIPETPKVQYDIPLHNKGSALILSGQFEEGIKCLDMALSINPSNEVTWVNKGNAHSKLGEHEIAKDSYQRAIELSPNYEIAWNNMGNVFARQADYLEALKHYNRAIKINPNYEDAWLNKAYILAKMGKREQAITCFNHAGSGINGEISPIDKDVQTA